MSAARSRSPASTRESKSRRRPPATASYVEIAIAYAEDALDSRNRGIYGKWIRLAAKRFLADLRRARRKRPPFVWSPDQANRYCAFIETLQHVEGTWKTPTIVLAPAQVFFVCQLFGFRRHDGSRRFTVALFAIARKNAKSTLAAAIMLACLCLEPEMGPQLVSAATTGDQARIVWGYAKRMVERDGELREAFSLEAFANSIARFDVGGSFRPINSKASTQDGLNPSALTFDELHAHKTRELFDVLRSAAGARKNPLSLYTTTEGYENTGPWQEIRRFAWQLLEGTVQADHFLVVYYAVDETDDDFDERAWKKANPLLGVAIALDKMRELAAEAKRMPGALAEFRTKRLNRPVAAAGAWCDLPKWKRCGRAVDLEFLAKHPCYGGLDVASTTDMAAWRLVWIIEEWLYTWGRCFIPAEGLNARAARGLAPFRTWAAEGWIEETPGDVIDHRVIKARILEDHERFQIQEVAFDPWNALQLVTELGEAGLTMVEFRQGAKSYNPAFQSLERYYIAGRMSHGGNPVLRWNMANLVPRKDPNLSLAPDRKRSAEKIDNGVALLMAVGRAELARTAAEQLVFVL